MIDIGVILKVNLKFRPSAAYIKGDVSLICAFIIKGLKFEIIKRILIENKINNIVFEIFFIIIINLGYLLFNNF